MNAVAEKQLPFQIVFTFDRVDGSKCIRRYEVVRKIGQGGFAQVFEGVNLNEPDQPKVAIKYLLPRPAGSLETSDETLVKRFDRERWVAMKVQSPNAVRGIDFGHDQWGQIFFVMEYVEGVTLKAILDEEKKRRKTLKAVESAKTPVISIERIKRIFPQICRGVRAMHRIKIVHRDLKPENFLVQGRDSYEQVKLADFGISKALKNRSGEDALHQNLTAEGILLGTPYYMAPEALDWNGPEPDERADIWALGIILYELVTGTTPFRNPPKDEVVKDEDDPRSALCRRIMRGTPEPYESYRAPFWELNRKLLARDPNERPQSVDEVLSLFEQVFDGSTQNTGRKALLPRPTPPPTPSSPDIDPALADTMLRISTTAHSPLAEPVSNEVVPLPEVAVRVERPRSDPPRSGREVTVRQPAVQARERFPWITSILTVIVIGAFGWVMLHRSDFRKGDAPDSPAPVSSATASASTSTSTASSASKVSSASVSAPVMSQKIVPGPGPQYGSPKSEARQKFDRYSKGLTNAQQCTGPFTKQSCELAIVLLRSTAVHFPTFPDPLGKIGDCQRKLGKTDDACKSYEEYRRFVGVKLTYEQQKFFTAKCH